MKSLNPQELAASLEIPVDTLERWIRQGRIPVTRTGAFCFFDEETLSHWARQHHLAFRIKKRPFSPDCSLPDNDLGAALQRGTVLHQIKGTTPETVLYEMVRAIPELPPDLAPLLQERLLERERLGSTGVGRGIALPHPRTPLPSFPEKNCIVAAFAERPVPYDAIDRKPVFVFFLLLASDVRAHLSLLSRFSRFLRDEAFYRLLSEKPEKTKLVEALSCEEALSTGSGIEK